MSRFTLAALLAAAALGFFAAAAPACLNDRESSKSEKEFKSHYGDAPPVPPAPASPPTTAIDQMLIYGGTGVGGALLVGGLTVTFLPRRRP